MTLLYWYEAGYYYTQRPDVWAAIVAGARYGIKRCAAFGDSRRTDPGGQGHAFAAEANNQFFRSFGSCGETPSSGLITFTDFAWLITQQVDAPGAAPIATNRLLPGLTSTSLAYYANGNGSSTVFDPRAVRYEGDPPDDNYLDPTDGIACDIFLATKSGSGQVYWRSAPADSPHPAFFNASNASGLYDPGLASATPAIVKMTVTLPWDASHPYPQLLLWSTNVNVSPLTTDLIAVRGRSVAKPWGIAVSTFGVPGATVASLAAYTNAGPLFRAMGFDYAELHFGINDQAAYDAATFQANTIAAIAIIRGWANDSNFPVRLCSAYHGRDLTRVDFAQHAGALEAIARIDPYVMATNTRRRTEDKGFGAAVDGVTGGAASEHMVDGSHANWFGQRLEARGEADDFFRAASLDPLTAQQTSAAAASGLYLASGTVASTTGITTTLDVGAVANADYYVNTRLVLTSGTGAGQERIITAYSVGRVATHAAWDVNPDAATGYRVEAGRVAATSLPSPVPTGYGGGSISPILAQSGLADPPPKRIEMSQGSAPMVPITCVDATGAAVPLTGTIRFVVGNGVASLTGAFQYETGGSGITIGGAGNNVASVQFSATDTATANSYRYWLWDVNNKLVRAKGDLVILRSVFAVGP